MRFKRPSAAWLVAVIALVLAVGTGSAVGSRLITGREIKNGSITGADIANRSITSTDIRNGSVKTADLSSSASDDLVGPAGPAGAAGAIGPVGPAGPPGPSAISKVTRVEAKGSIAPGDINHVSVTCPDGQTLVDGSFITAGAGTGVFYSDSFGSPNQWGVGYDNYDSSVSADVTAVAYCAISGQAVGAIRSAPSAEREADALDTKQRAAH